MISKKQQRLETNVGDKKPPWLAGVLHLVRGCSLCALPSQVPPFSPMRKVWVPLETLSNIRCLCSSGTISSFPWICSLHQPHPLQGPELILHLLGPQCLSKTQPMQRQGQIPSELMAGLVLKPGNTKKTLPQSCGLGGMSAVSLSSSGNTEGPQTGQSPLLLSIRSEHTHFLLGASAVFAGAAFALARSQEREGKHCKVKCVLTWVSSSRNRVNNRKMPALSERLPSHFPQSLLQRLPVACIS